MQILNKSLFFGDVVFFLSDIFIVYLLITLLCFGLFFNKYINSMGINKLIIDLVIPLLLINLVFYHYLFDLDLFYFFNFKSDNFVIFFKVLFCIFLIICLKLSCDFFLLEKVKIFEYVIIILLSVQGSLLVASTTNLFVMYVGLEIQNLCFFVLACLNRFSNFSVESGLKYFLFGSLSSSFLLFGISLFYGLLGTVDIFDFFFILLDFNFDIFYFLIYLSFFFFLSGLMFKLGSVPFHWWLPDVYEGSPTVVMLFFSVMPKLLYIFLLIKFYFFFIFELNIGFFFLFLGIVSIVIGGFSAIYQLKIKRFLAYSTIVNIGFILLAFGTNNFFGMSASIFYLLCYIFTIFLFFWILLYVRKNNSIEFERIYELSFLNYNVGLLFLLSIVFFSFLGLPPFMGFFGKFFVYLNLFMNFNYLVLIFLMFFSVFISFYYLRVIRFLYFSFYNKKNIMILNLNLVFILFCFFNIFFIFFFDICIEFIDYVLIYTFYL